MVRTGARALTLRGLLVSVGLRPITSAGAPRIGALPSETTDLIRAYYRALGGRSDVPLRLRPGAWDLAFEGGLVVELDEELHFNRYRQLALEADWLPMLPWTSNYLTFCRERETSCLAAGNWGKRWTTASCEVMFGAADPPGILGSKGAPRWKQRALYDLIKDMFALSGTSVRLVRLATHDYVDGVEIGAGLQGHATLDLTALAALMNRRST